MSAQMDTRGTLSGTIDAATARLAEVVATQSGNPGSNPGSGASEPA
jgi:hypothetical protein